MTTYIWTSSRAGSWLLHRERRIRYSPLCGVMTAIILAVGWLGGVATLTAKERQPATYQIPLPPTPDFSSIDWLLGEWSGKTGEHDSLSGDFRFSVSYELDKRIMFLRGQASFKATAASLATEESWIGIIVYDRGSNGFLLRMYSSKGFITRYRLAVEGPEIRINPEGGEQPPVGWLFRAIIHRTDSEELIETVQAAPPARPFFDYYTVKLSRVTVQQDQGKAKATPAASP